MSTTVLGAYLLRIDETISTSSQWYNNARYDAAAALSLTEHYPYFGDMLGLNSKFTAMYGITQVPIPTINTPFLLNLTGANLGITLTWSSITMNDVAFFLQYFPTANPGARIVVDLTQSWGATSSTNTIVMEKFNDGSDILGSGVLRFVGVINSFSVEEVAGAVLWNYNMDVILGVVEG